MRKFLIIIFTFLTAKAFCCSCTYQGNFMQLAERTDFIALVKVISFPDYDSTKSLLPTQMQVEIIETLKGQSKTTSIIVFGQDGINCLEWLNKFKVGNTYGLSLYANRSRDTMTNNLQAFNLSTCGDYWISYDGSNVTGVITKKRTKAFAKQLRKLNDAIGKAIDDDNEVKETKMKEKKQALYDSLKETMNYGLFKSTLGGHVQSSS